MNNLSLSEIKDAIEQLSFEERVQLAAWLHGWKDDGWDEQMKRDVAGGKFDDVVREVEDDIKAGRLRSAGSTFNIGHKLMFEGTLRFCSCGIESSQDSEA